LLSAIHEIKDNYLSLENYVCEELKFDFKDIDKLKNLYLT